MDNNILSYGTPSFHDGNSYELCNVVLSHRVETVKIVNI